MIRKSIHSFITLCSALPGAASRERNLKKGQKSLTSELDTRVLKIKIRNHKKVGRGVRVLTGNINTRHQTGQ